MNALFEDALTLSVLGSGSKGNTTYIGNGRHGVLVDCGLSTKQILLRMESIGLAGAPIDAVLITHEHSDHVGSARVLSKRLHKIYGHDIPFYMTDGTHSRLQPKVMPSRITIIDPGAQFAVGSLTVEAFAIPHDTPSPVAYAVEFMGVRAGVITDLGRSTTLVEQQLREMDIAVLEFNHDLTMLLEGEYPWPLKQRIHGSHGHLSNTQGADLLAKAMSERLKHVVLSHLSDENNTPEKAWSKAMSVITAAGREDVTLHLARQDKALQPLQLFASDTPRPPTARPAPRDTVLPATLPEAPKQLQSSLFL